MITCKKCGAENQIGAKFCQMCASSLSAGNSSSEQSQSSPLTTAVFSVESSRTLVCPVCDAANKSDQGFCQQCGSKLGKPTPDLGAAQHEPTPPKGKAYATTITAPQPADDLKKAYASPRVTCTKCSQPTIEGGEFCHKCGSPIAGTKTITMASLRTAPKARLLLIVDGQVTGDEFDIDGDTVIGRTAGDVTFAHDDYMSGRHARIAVRGDKFILIDEESRNGSFIRVKKEVELKSGDHILLGKQLFRFEV